MIANAAISHIDSTDQMHEFGVQLAHLFQAGDLVCLQGPLGAGKTCLARGIISKLVPDATDITSPTYNLVHEWQAPEFAIWHVDLYRIDTTDQIAELGLEDAFGNALCLVEWPERLGALVPDNRLDVKISITKTGRKIALMPRGKKWQERLNAFAK